MLKNNILKFIINFQDYRKQRRMHWLLDFVGAIGLTFACLLLLGELLSPFNWIITVPMFIGFCLLIDDCDNQGRQIAKMRR